MKVHMINKKFNLTKGGWLILLCCGIILVGANQFSGFTNAMKMILKLYAINASGPGANGWYTEYTLDANIWGVRCFLH